MKHKFHKFLCALLAVLVCVGFSGAGGPAALAAQTASGTCGEGLTWSLANGTLTISGAGPMQDYTEFTPAPWQPYMASIQRVVVADGVTHVGSMALYHCTALTVAVLPASVLSVGDLAFAGCYALAQVSLPAVQTIGWGAFYDCLALANLTLPPSLGVIGTQAFYRCSSLAGITIPASVYSMGNSVFTYCTGLVYVRMEAPLSVLPYWTFYGCDLLTELILPDTITTVESDALSQCPQLTWVDYDGPQETQDEIRRQLSQADPSVQNTGALPEVSYTQTGGASVTTSTTTDYDETAGITTDTHVGATVTDPSGWADVTQGVNDAINQGKQPTVDVQLQGDAAMPEGAFGSLADRDVTVNVHTDQNVDWQVVMGDQTADTLAGGQDLSVSITPNTSGKHDKTLGGAESYNVTLGKTTFNSTILFPLGSDTARRTATLYKVGLGGLQKLASVVVDDDGKAAFSLAGTDAGDYILALDVPEIDPQEVTIPQKLAPQYDVTYGATLTDAYGNQYVLTGRVNKLGFGAGTLAVIVIGIMLGSALIIGIVMTAWNKQKLRAQQAQWQKQK